MQLDVLNCSSIMDKLKEVHGLLGTGMTKAKI